MKKRLVSLLLAAVLLLGLMPTALAATITFDDFFAGLNVIAETEPGSPSSTNKWKVTTLDGEDVLMSGNKGKSNSSSTLQLTFTSDTTMTFDYKVSSEANYDKLTVKLGETTLVGGVSGKIDWTTLEVEAKNKDVLTITYSKDGSGDRNDDCVYLRNFSTGTPAVVTFHAGNGTGEDHTQKIYNGKGKLKANTFTCDGKVFAGWATSADSTVIAYSDGASIETTANMDLYALWADAVTVTFMNGDTTVKTIDVAKDAPIGALNIPADLTKYGYKFAGWYDGVTQLTADTVIAEARTFTAKWDPITYTIKFDKDASDAEGEVASIENVKYDEEKELPMTGLTRPGYTFNGWATSRGSSSGKSKAFKETNRDGATVTLYAAWRGNDVTLTIDPNYEGAQTATRTTAVGSNYNYNKQKDGSFKFDSIADPTRTGYIFLGWFDAAEGGNEITNQYRFTAADAENGRTLYAHWEEGITVHFDGNGYNDRYNQLKDKTVKKDKVFSSLPSYLDKSNYPANKALDGWYIKNADGSFGEAVTKGTDFSALSEVTLIAKWRDYQYIIKYNLKYSDKSSVTGTMEDQPAPFGQDVKLTKCTLARAGYEFAGWSESSYNPTVKYADEATIKREWVDDDWDGSEDGETYNLYAVWTEAKSPEQTAADAKLAAAETAISGTYNCTWGTDKNALTMINAKLAAAGITDVTVAVKAGASENYSSSNYVGVADDGTLQYKWNENGSTPAASGTVRPTVVLTYNDGKTDYHKESTECLFNLPLDETKAIAALNAVAARITVPETVEAAADLTSLPKYPLKAGVDASKVNYNNSTDLELWATAAWQSNPTNVISVTGVDYPIFSPYKATVSIPESDTTVTLTLTLTYSGREDLNVNHVYTVNVKGSKQTPKVDYQKLLDDVFDAPRALYDPGTGNEIDKKAVKSDIHFPTTRNLNSVCDATYGKEFDGKYTPIVITSNDQNVIKDLDTNAARAMVYRPLPGAEDAKVKLTVTIYDRPSGEGKDFTTMKKLATKEIELTVKALTWDELNEASAFMTKVCTADVYWNGIKKANSDKDHVTGDLQWFFEIVPDGDDYKFIRTSDESKWVGVKVDDIDGWYASEKYRIFRSSIPSVIAHENLLVTQPEYNTPVKIDSVLTHAVYGKYYEKYKDDPVNKWTFSQFYKQPVETVVTVTGTTGKVNPDVKKIEVTVNVEGHAFDESFTDLTDTYTCYDNEYKTAAVAVLDVLAKAGYTYTGAPSYITSVTDNKNHTMSAGDKAHGPWSGWMFTVDGEQPELSPGWGAALDQYLLKAEDHVIRFYYVDCPTATGHHTPKDGSETITKAATHEETGTKTYTCSVCNGTITETIPATGHDWGETSYIWADNYASCTALRKCKGNDGGVATETTNNVTYAVVTPATATAAGLGRYTATFENEAFQTQTHDVTIPATGGSTSGGSTGGSSRPSGSKKDNSAAETPKTRFDDVKSSHWYQEAVDYVAENGIMDGTAARTFSPNAPATRAMLVTVLHRLAGTPDAEQAHGFTDLANGAWYAGAVAWAAENGIVDGVGDALFAPNAHITREQLAAILYRYAIHCGLDVTAAADLNAYADGAQVSPWAQDAMRWAIASGLISGRSASALAPQSGATRAEIAQILMNFARLLKK